MLLSLYVSTFAIRASFAIMLIVFPLYILSLKSYFLFGIVLSSSPAFELITVLGLGAYIDRHGRKNVLLIGLLTGSVALFALLVSTDPVYLFAVNAVHGMSAAAILVSSLALLADYAPPEKRGRAMGAFDFVNIFGWISGFGIGGLLIDVYHDNIGMAFVFAGAIALFAFALAFLNVHEPHKEAHLGSEISFRVIASVLKQRSVLLLVAPWFIIYLLISTMLTFTSKAGTQELGLTGTQLGLILGGGGAIFLVTQVIYGQLSDKYGRTRIMIVGTTGIVGIMLTVGAVFLTAPPMIAPATGRIVSFTPGGDGLLQSDFGLYTLDLANGTVRTELGPPEGGFGILQEPRYGTSGTLVSTNRDSVKVISITDDQLLWATPADHPHAVASADLDLDGSVEIFFADADGLHVTGPDALSFPPVLPQLGPDEKVLDAGWFYPGDLLILLATDTSARLVRATPGGEFSVAVPSGYHRIAMGPASDAAYPEAVAVIGEPGALLVNFSAPSNLDTRPFPSGYEAAWVCGPDGGARLVAYSPNGATAIFFNPSPGGVAPQLVSLPGGLRSVAWSCGAQPPTVGAPVQVVFAGYGENGTFATVALNVGSTVSAEPASAFAVLVQRETAQATFGHLTSPAVAIPLGIFALMAGAFGPAALAGLTDVSQSDKRGTTMGLYSVVISSSMIVGPVTTGYLVDNYGGFGVMIFLVLSATAMGLLMALRAWDVRRAGGEHKLHPVPREQLAGPPTPAEIAAPPVGESDLAARALSPQTEEGPPET